MELLNEEIVNSENFSFLCSFFKNSKKSSEISYEIFKMNLVNFAKQIMKAYLKNTPYCNDFCHCFGYGDMNGKYGSYNPNFNVILINEDVIKNMYKNRNLGSLTVLFHELNHFKMKYDIKLGYFDESLVYVIKEELISKSPLFPSFIKMSEEEKKSTYYEDNYEYYSEEKLADLCAIENLFQFMKLSKISLTVYQKEQLDALIRKYAKQYKNHYRDVSNNINFNSYVINFEEAFDILVKDNPSWLEYPQLQIEYYIDEEGKVIKRNDVELKELLVKTENPYIKEYIEKLLTKDNKKSNYANLRKSILNNKINFKNLNKSNKL